MTEEFCPLCHNSLQGNPIPEESQKYYGSSTHYSRRQGHEIWGVYDGILFWVCPDCLGAWPRFTEGELGERAQEYVDKHNAAVALRDEGE